MGEQVVAGFVVLASSSKIGFHGPRRISRPVTCQSCDSSVVRIDRCDEQKWQRSVHTRSSGTTIALLVDDDNFLRPLQLSWANEDDQWTRLSKAE